MVWDGRKKDGTSTPGGPGDGTGGLLGVLPGYLTDVDNANPQYPVVSSLLAFINTDQVTADADDETIYWHLTGIPLAGSLHIRQNGIDLRADEYVLMGNVVVITASAELVIRDGDVFDAAYAWTGSVPPPPDITASGDTYNIDSWLMPGTVSDGDLLVAFAFLPNGATVDGGDLNGYVFAGESVTVTHSAHAGTFTYRLGIWWRTKPVGSSPLPVVSTVAADTVCVMQCFTGATSLNAIEFGTVANDDSADSPAISPRSDLRIYGVVANAANLTPAAGTVRSVNGGSVADVSHVVTTDPETTQIGCVTDGPLAGWMLASVVLA